MKVLIDKLIEIEEIVFFFKLFKLHKSYLALISDQKEMGIGDVTLASPERIKGVKSTSSSYNLFGIHQKLLSSVIAKRMTNYLDAPVLVLLFMKNKVEEKEFTPPLVEFINNCLEEVGNS